MLSLIKKEYSDLKIDTFLKVSEYLIQNYGKENVYLKLSEIDDFSFLSIAYLYNNLRDVEYYTNKLIVDNEVDKSKILQINIAFFLLRNGAKYIDIFNFLENRFKEDFNVNYLKIFENEKNVEKIRNFEKKYEEELNLEENLQNSYFNYIYFLRNNKENHLENLAKIFEFNTFYSREEIVKWLATNNRKTKEFFADYGLETNELIKFVLSPYFIDYSYKETIKILKISNFSNYLSNDANIEILGLRAILTSIINRERFGVGSISRAIKDGLVSNVLEKYIELIK